MMGQNNEKIISVNPLAEANKLDDVQFLHPHSLGLCRKRNQILPIFQGFYTIMNGLPLEQLFIRYDSCTNRSEHGIVIDMRKDDMLKFISIIASKYPDLAALSLMIDIDDSNDTALCAAIQDYIASSNLHYLSLQTSAPEAPSLWQSVAKGIRSNSTIKELAFYHSYSCKDEGLIALCDSLMVNTSLEILRVDRCHLSDEGFKALSNVIKVNKTLKHIFAVDNCGYEALEEGLECNTTLLSLYISNNTTYIQTKVKAILERNNKLARIRELLAPMSVLMINIKHGHQVLPLELWIHIFSYVLVDSTRLDGLMHGVSRGTIERCLASQAPIRYKTKRHKDALDIVILE